MAIYQKIPEGVLNLQLELERHPDLRAWLIEEGKEMVALPTVLGLLAARLNIMLDGQYDIPTLCETLARELKRKREQAAINITTAPDSGIIILPN